MTDIPSDSNPKTLNPETERSNFSITTFFPPTKSIANPCDTNRLKVSDKPVHLLAHTNATNCDVLVTTENRTAISVTLLKSDTNNVFSYFYIEILENSIQMCTKRYLLVSSIHTPCKVIIPGNQFRLYFQNTEMMLELRAEDDELSTCYDTPFPQMAFKICNVTDYESEIKWSKKTQTLHFGRSWSLDRIKVDVVQYHARCICNFPSKRICTLGYRKWVSKCIDSKHNTTRVDLIVYNPYAKGLSFANCGMHMIQQHAFLGELESINFITIA